MLEKISFPKEYIVNQEIPLDKFYSEEDISKYEIEKVVLFASINKNMNHELIGNSSDSRYNELHFILIKFNKIITNSDHYHLAKEIFKAIHYQCIVIFEMDKKIKFFACNIEPGKRDFEENILNDYVFTNWIFDDFITEEEKDFFISVSNTLNTETDIQNLFICLKRDIQSLKPDLIKSSTIDYYVDYYFSEQSIRKQIQEQIKKESIKYKAYKHSDGKHFKISEDDVFYLYENASVWRAMCLNDFFKKTINRLNIRNINELIPNIIDPWESEFKKEQNYYSLGNLLSKDYIDIYEIKHVLELLSIRLCPIIKDQESITTKAISILERVKTVILLKNPDITEQTLYNFSYAPKYIFNILKTDKELANEFENAGINQIDDIFDGESRRFMDDDEDRFWENPENYEDDEDEDDWDYPDDYEEE